MAFWKFPSGIRLTARTAVISAFTVGLCFAFIGCGPGEDPSSKAGAPAETEAVDAPEEEPDNREVNPQIRVNIEKAVNLTWWHREELVDELVLAVEQQKRMDEFMADFLREWPSRMQDRRGATKRFIQALHSGDIRKAREIGERAGAAADFAEGGVLILKANVLGELTPEQLEILLADHSPIVKGRWVTSGKLKSRKVPE